MMKFSTSIWAKDGDFNVRSIGTVEEAIAFLENWPITERGPLYYAAANSIESASAGSIPPNEAKDGLIEFLEGANALAEERLST